MYRRSGILAYAIREIGKALRYNDKILRSIVKDRYEKAIKELDKGLKIQRYCFVTKNVQTFILCGNCDQMFCIDGSHVDWEEDEGFSGEHHSYPIHRKCL